MQAGKIIFVIILIASPFLGSVIISMFNLIIDEEIPPILPQINSYSFGQAVVALVAAGVISQQIEPIQVLLGVGLLLGLFFLLLFQTLVDKKQKQITQLHVSSVLSDETKVKLKEGFSLEPIAKIARSLIDVDLFPNSPPNKWSGFPRKHRRERLVDLIREYLGDNGDVDLKQEDFLVPSEKRQSLRFAYTLITVISLILYFSIISLFITVTT